jgi:hypothetical protein
VSIVIAAIVAFIVLFLGVALNYFIATDDKKNQYVASFIQKNRTNISNVYDRSHTSHALSCDSLKCDPFQEFENGNNEDHYKKIGTLFAALSFVLLFTSALINAARCNFNSSKSILHSIKREKDSAVEWVTVPVRESASVMTEANADFETDL